MTADVDTQRAELMRCSGLLAAAPPDSGVVAASALGPLRPERFDPLVRGAVARVELLRRIGWASTALDRDLEHPASWGGPDRKALARGIGTNTPWLRMAFESVSVSDDPLTFPDLVRWNTIAGADGRLRERPIRVDGHLVPFSPERSVELAERQLAMADDGAGPPALLAARVHLGLLLAHPFADGNGRVARLLASVVLLRAGHRSSLVTCVEQHFHARPARYAAVLGRLRRQEIDVDQVVNAFLGAMAARVVPAAWFRARVTAEAESASPLSVEPFERIAPRVRPDIARELRSQLARVCGDLARHASS